MDGGANCNVINDEKYFILLHKKPIKCGLALNSKSEVQGIGLAAFSLPNIKNYFILAPTYYHPDKNSNTISTGALLHYSKFTTALHHPFKKLELKTPCGQLIEIPTKIKNGLDYVDLSIHHFGGIPKTKTEKYPFINIMPPKINTLRAADPNLALYLHIKLGHINENYLQIMAKRGLIDGVPKNIGKLKFKCPICTIANGQKMPPSTSL